jgi:hypothetical protein
MKRRELLRDVYLWLRDKVVLPDRRTIMQDELAEAWRAKLGAETSLEFAKSVLAYNDARIARLTPRLKETTE